MITASTVFPYPARRSSFFLFAIGTRQLRHILITTTFIIMNNIILLYIIIILLYYIKTRLIKTGPNVILLKSG